MSRPDTTIGVLHDRNRPGRSVFQTVSPVFKSSAIRNESKVLERSPS